jgi:hypothetical protein
MIICMVSRYGGIFAPPSKHQFNDERGDAFGFHDSHFDVTVSSGVFPRFFTRVHQAVNQRQD